MRSAFLTLTQGSDSMAITVGDIYQGRLKYIMANQVCYNVFHFRAIAGGSSNTAVNQLLSALTQRLATYSAQIAPALHQSVQWQEVSAVAIHALAGAHGRIQNVTTVGQRTGELLPGFVALPFFLNTDYYGRSRRGRTHVGGFTEDDQNAGRLSSVGETMADVITASIQNSLMSGSYWDLIVYSRKIAQVNNIGPTQIGNQDQGMPDTIWANVTRISNGDIFGSMYSRKIGRGS